MTIRRRLAVLGILVALAAVGAWIARLRWRAFLAGIEADRLREAERQAALDPLRRDVAAAHAASAAAARAHVAATSGSDDEPPEGPIPLRSR